MDEARPQPVRSLPDYAEVPREGDWSMRSALVRFAQPEPVLAGELLELVRRLDTVLQRAPVADLTTDEGATVPLLGVAAELDALAEVLARWASGGPDDPPVAAVAETCRTVREQLDALGVPPGTRPPRRGRP